MPWLQIVGQIISMIAQHNAAQTARHNIQDIPTRSEISSAVQSFDPSTYGTGVSSVSPQYTQIDPTLTGLRQNILGNLQGLYPQAGNIYGGLLSQAGFNSPAFVQSVVDPYSQQVANAWGDLMQNQGRMGIRGTSFANNDVLNFANTAGRGLSDVTASALERSLGMQGSFADRLFTSQQGILGQMENINQDQLRQELAALGLSQNAIQLMMPKQFKLSEVMGAGTAGQGAGLMGLGSMLGGLMGGAGGGGLGGGGMGLTGGGEDFAANPANLGFIH